MINTYTKTKKMYTHLCKQSQYGGHNPGDLLKNVSGDVYKIEQITPSILLAPLKKEEDLSTYTLYTPDTKLPDTKILDTQYDNYSINLLWISKSRTMDNQIEHIKSRCRKWAQYNKGKVFLWVNRPEEFASDHVFNMTVNVRSFMDTQKTDDIVVDTQIENMIRTNTVEDTYDDARIPENRKRLARIPFFLLIDFLKNVIAHIQLKTYTYVVVTDLDVNELPSKYLSGEYKPYECEINTQLIKFAQNEENRNTFYQSKFIFDEHTRDMLDTYGVIFACKNELGLLIRGIQYPNTQSYENSYMIFKNTSHITKLIYDMCILYCFDIETDVYNARTHKAFAIGLIHRYYIVFYILLLVFIGKIQSISIKDSIIDGETVIVDKSFLSVFNNFKNVCDYLMILFMRNDPNNLFERIPGIVVEYDDEFKKYMAKVDPTRVPYIMLPTKQLIMEKSKLSI